MYWITRETNHLFWFLISQEESKTDLDIYVFGIRFFLEKLEFIIDPKTGWNVGDLSPEPCDMCHRYLITIVFQLFQEKNLILYCLSIYAVQTYT